MRKHVKAVGKDSQGRTVYRTMSPEEISERNILMRYLTIRLPVWAWLGIALGILTMLGGLFLRG